MKHKKKNIIKQIFCYRTDIGLAMLSALFLILFSYKIYFVSYFAVAPFLIIIYSRGFKAVIALCALIGLASSLFLFDWVYAYKTNIYILVIILWTLFFTAFAALTHLVYHKIKHLSLFVAPIVWTGIMLVLDLTKYGSYIFEFSMYNSLTAPLIWLIGGRGVTFVVIALNSAIAGFAVKKTKKRALAIVVISLILISCHVYSNTSEAEGEPLNVVLVQGNFHQTWEWRQDHITEIFDTYMMLSEGKGKESLIVWPEYALPMDVVNYYPDIIKKIKSFVKKYNAYLITGSLIYDKETGDHYDTALLFNPEDHIGSYNSVYPAFYNEHTLKGGEGIKLFTIKGKQAGIMICAEEYDSKIAREQTKKGAQFLISISNNQNFSRGIYLSSPYSKLRAAENYKYLIRTTNTGITQIINPYGKVYDIEPNKQKLLIKEVRLNNHKTPYTKYGDMPLYIAMLLFIILIKKRGCK